MRAVIVRATASSEIVTLPVGSVVELVGQSPISGLLEGSWEGQAYSVFGETLRQASESIDGDCP